MIKPTIKLNPTLDLIDTLDYLEFIGHKGIHNLLWDHFSRDGLNNFNSFCCYLPHDEDDYKEDEVRNALHILKKEFDIEEDTIWFKVVW